MGFHSCEAASGWITFGFHVVSAGRHGVRRAVAKTQYFLERLDIGQQCLEQVPNARSHKNQGGNGMVLATTAATVERNPGSVEGNQTRRGACQFPWEPR